MDLEPVSDQRRSFGVKSLEDDQYKKQWYYLFLAFEANLELPNLSGEVAFKKYTENSKKQRMIHARNRSTSPIGGTRDTNV